MVVAAIPAMVVVEFHKSVATGLVNTVAEEANWMTLLPTPPARVRVVRALVENVIKRLGFLRESLIFYP